AIDEIKGEHGDLVSSGTLGYSEPLTKEFLKQNPHLVLDTQFFSTEFKERLIGSLNHFDEQCEGLLIHSENFQALNLLQKRYREQVRCVHIDPPYNTKTSGFLYKNAYEHSSWLSMMNDRIAFASSLLDDKGEFICHIDENEYERLSLLFNNHSLNTSGTIIWDKMNPMLGRKGIATQHEYIIWRSKYDRSILGRSESIVEMQENVKSLIKKYGVINESVRQEYREWLKKQENFSGGEKTYKHIDDDGNIYRLVAMGAPERRTDPKYHIPLKHPVTGKNCPVPPNGWSRTPDTLADLIKDKMIVFGNDETTQPQKKAYLREDALKQITSVYCDAKSGKDYLDLLGSEFPYSHPVSMYQHLLSFAQESVTFIDFFAGSGTNGHAVLNLIRATNYRHKSILVEMGDHFDTVLKPRIAKVVYSEEWKEGKPVSRDTGISHCFKYLRLESYEDALNNIEFRQRDSRLPLGIQEEYLLSYMLETESGESACLLNIEKLDKPFSYEMSIARNLESQKRSIDLVETFNYLIGLRVRKSHALVSFDADFITGEYGAVSARLKAGNTYKFKAIEGTLPNGEEALVVWREMSDDIKNDNAVLDAYFLSLSNGRSFEQIYVNCDNNLLNLREEGESWRVDLIDVEMKKRMFEETE
ncbi:MAG: site-specific DNA-methyltransferase, partial [Candidatus Hydrogenedentes bacterium]|nr:site-specific DNA-methyltransferase [Candidatus Hydrogenedentota bacterium]